MGAFHEESYTLVPLTKSNSLTDADEPNSDDSENEEFTRKTEHFRAAIGNALRTSATGAQNRRKFRGFNSKRLKRLILCAFAIPMILFLALYSSIFSGASSRRYPLPDWDIKTSLNITDYVLPLNDTTILEPKEVCRDRLFLLIIVCSGLTNFEARQTVRETWGNTSEFNYSIFEKLHHHLSDNYLTPKKERLKQFESFLILKGNQTKIETDYHSSIPVRIVFLLGRNKDSQHMVGNETHTRLLQELEQHNDIIQENFMDSYNNLTIKSVMSLKWIIKNNCHKNTAFFMKCDDDTFVNVPNLIHFLLGGTVPLYNETLDYYDNNSYQTLAPRNRLNETANYMVGYMFCKAPVLSSTKSKWYMPYYMYPGDIYPHYLSGSGYLMSMDVVPKLYKAALNTSLIYLEDVYVTGMCAEKAHVKRHHHPLFSYGRYKKNCTLKGMVTVHNIKTDDMYAAYNFVKNVSYQCPPPGRYFKRIRLRKITGCG